VGKTYRGSPSPTRRADHPHAGGENSSGQRKETVTPGPSPRGWGKRAVRAA